jgi:transposase
MRKGGEKVLSQIEEVSMDMTGNSKSLVKKLCPNGEVTVDRFPVITRVQSELNQAMSKWRGNSGQISCNNKSSVRVKSGDN